MTPAFTALGILLIIVAIPFGPHARATGDRDPLVWFGCVASSASGAGPRPGARHDGELIAVAVAVLLAPADRARVAGASWPSRVAGLAGERRATARQPAPGSGSRAVGGVQPLTTGPAARTSSTTPSA